MKCTVFGLLAFGMAATIYKTNTQTHLMAVQCRDRRMHCEPSLKCIEDLLLLSLKVVIINDPTIPKVLESFKFLER